MPIKEHINLTLLNNFVVGLIKSQLFIYISYYSRKFEPKTVTLGHHDLLDWSEKPLGLDNPLVYTESHTHRHYSEWLNQKGVVHSKPFFLYRTNFNVWTEGTPHIGPKSKSYRKPTIQASGVRHLQWKGKCNYCINQRRSVIKLPVKISLLLLLSSKFSFTFFPSTLLEGAKSQTTVTQTCTTCTKAHYSPLNFE